MHKLCGPRHGVDVQLALRFANSLTNTHDGINWTENMLVAAIQPVYEGIHEARWTDADLQALQAAFAMIDPIRNTANTISTTPDARVSAD